MASRGPIKTLAAAASRLRQDLSSSRDAPLRRNVTTEEVGNVRGVPAVGARLRWTGEICTSIRLQPRDAGLSSTAEAPAALLLLHASGLTSIFARSRRLAG